MNEFELTINETLYQGWKTAAAKRTMKALANGFSLDVTDTWTGQERPWPIKVGDACSLSIDGVEILDGYVDTVNPSISADQKTIQVAGRCKAGDLVDCSASDEPGEFLKVPLTAIVKKLTAPFAGISVEALTNVGEKFPVWKVTPGEGVFESIERAARQRAVLIYSDGLGKVLLARAGTERLPGALVQGQNVLTAAASFSMVDRFSNYTVKSQVGGFEDMEAEDAQTIEGKASDRVVSRHRPKILIAESQSEPSNAKKRAQWEAAVRAGQAEAVSCTVVGFYSHGESLWDVNKQVRFTSTWLGVDADFLITEVDFSKTEQGSITTLTLENPNVYKLLEEIPPQSSSVFWDIPQ